MQFDGLSGIEELNGKKIGVFLFPLVAQPRAISALVTKLNGEWCVDCLPSRKGKYVWPIPDDSFVSASSDKSFEYLFAIFINEKSGTGLLIRDAIAKSLISLN